MHTSTLLITLVTLLTTLTSLTTAAPAPTPLTNFYLVTTTQPTAETNSSHLTNVRATTLFDPFQQKTFLLRLIDPGYNSLPTFNFSSGVLHSLTQGIGGLGMFVYNSTDVQTGGELSFVPQKEGKGSLGLREGFLLTVGGKAKGWTICPGEEGESVIKWVGMDPKCNQTYIQAVAKPPY